VAGEYSLLYFGRLLPHADVAIRISTVTKPNVAKQLVQTWRWMGMGMGVPYPAATSPFVFDTATREMVSRSSYFMLGLNRPICSHGCWLNCDQKNMPINRHIQNANQSHSQKMQSMAKRVHIHTLATSQSVAKFATTTEQKCATNLGGSLEVPYRNKLQGRAIANVGVLVYCDVCVWRHNHSD
jgi:hypothetical protein